MAWSEEEEERDEEEEEEAGRTREAGGGVRQGGVRQGGVRQGGVRQGGEGPGPCLAMTLWVCLPQATSHRGPSSPWKLLRIHRKRSRLDTTPPSPLIHRSTPAPPDTARTQPTLSQHTIPQPPPARRIRAYTYHSSYTRGTHTPIRRAHASFHRPVLQPGGVQPFRPRSMQGTFPARVRRTPLFSPVA